MDNKKKDSNNDDNLIINQKIIIEAKIIFLDDKTTFYSLYQNLLTTKYSELFTSFDEMTDTGLDIIKGCVDKWIKIEYDALFDAFYQVYNSNSNNKHVSVSKSQAEIDKELSEITQKLENIRILSQYYGIKKNDTKRLF